MLSHAHRLTEAASFQQTVRRGRRSSSRALVVHALRPDGRDPASVPRAGLIVSRAVGGSVQRNLVKRRLRHLLRARIGGWEPGTQVVIRALPGAAARSSTSLGGELDLLLDKCLAERSGGSA